MYIREWEARVGEGFAGAAQRAREGRRGASQPKRAAAKGGIRFGSGLSTSGDSDDGGDGDDDGDVFDDTVESAQARGGMAAVRARAAQLADDAAQPDDWSVDRAAVLCDLYEAECRWQEER